MKRRGFIQSLAVGLLLPAGALVELPRRRVYSFPSFPLPPEPGAFCQKMLKFYADNFSGFVMPEPAYDELAAYMAIGTAGPRL